MLRTRSRTRAPRDSLEVVYASAQRTHLYLQDEQNPFVSQLILAHSSQELAYDRLAETMTKHHFA